MDAERQRSPARINAHLRDSRMRVLGDKSPLRKVQGLGPEAESDDEYAPSKGTESHYRSETPMEFSKAREPCPRRKSQDYISEEIPSRDPVIRLLFQRIQKMKDDQTRSQEPNWGKLQPGPFTERIKKSRPDRETDRLYSADDLYMVWQREDEPLREYAACFSHEYSRCLKTDDRVAYGAFKSGLWSSHFRYLVHSSNWRTYDELMKQAAVHAKAEYFNSKPGPSARQEGSATKSYPGRTDDSSARHKRKDDRDHRQGNSKKGRGKYGRNDHRAPLPNPDRAQEVFTLLNTTYEAFLMNEHDQISKPNHRKPNWQDNRDTGKFCRYHQQNSHNTEDCISLRKIIERLIREEKLDQYIARPQQAPAANANQQINMISTISVGLTLAGPSNRSIKQYVRAAHYPQVFGIEDDRCHKVPKVGWEPITFCEEEEEGIIYPHDDPMIIRA
ncbi:unnamed protein product [Prunus armeniaca]